MIWIIRIAMQIVPGVKLDEGSLKLFVSGREVEPEVRWLSQLKGVLMRPEDLGEDGIAYLMYRDLPPLMGSWARFDLTIILNWEVGGELAKTKGHYHLPVDDELFPEVYYVHHGEAAFLLQKRGHTVFEVEDFIIVRAREGTMVKIPEDYGHVTVNLGENALIVSNIIHRKVRPDYASYEIARGAAYYLTRSGIIRNANYASVPEPRYEEAEELGGSLYELLKDESFLKKLKT